MFYVLWKASKQANRALLLLLFLITAGEWKGDPDLDARQMSYTFVSSQPDCCQAYGVCWQLTHSAVW